MIKTFVFLFSSLLFSKMYANTLYIGDSLSVGALGEELYKEFGESQKVHLLAVGGSEPRYFLKKYPVKIISGGYRINDRYFAQSENNFSVPKIEDLLTTIKPKSVIIQNGTNLFYYLKVNGESYVENLLKEFIGSAMTSVKKCYFVLPPNARTDKISLQLQDQMEELIEKSLGKTCQLFKSRELPFLNFAEGEGDGIHYGPTKYRMWAKELIKDLKIFFN